MVILILQVRKQDLEKLNGFSEITEPVHDGGGTLSPVYCDCFAFGIALFTQES